MTPLDDLTGAQLKALRASVVLTCADRDRGCVAKALVPSVKCKGQHDPHEIIPRSAWRDGIYVLDNVVEVCRAHHDWIDDHPDLAHKVGLHGFSWERPDARAAPE